MENRQYIYAGLKWGDVPTGWDLRGGGPGDRQSYRDLCLFLIVKLIELERSMLILQEP